MADESVTNQLWMFCIILGGFFILIILMCCLTLLLGILSTVNIFHVGSKCELFLDWHTPANGIILFTFYHFNPAFCICTSTTCTLKLYYRFPGLDQRVCASQHSTLKLGATTVFGSLQAANLLRIIRLQLLSCTASAHQK